MVCSYALYRQYEGSRMACHDPDLSRVFAIARNMAENVGQLTQVSFANEQIGYQGVIVLAEALKVNTEVKELDLSGNGLCDNSVRVLAEALKVNMALTTLDLSSNSIGDDGAAAVAEALKVRT